MSWNKQTVNFSMVDFAIETLKRSGSEYTLTVLGEVNDNGLMSENEKIPLRRLAYDNLVILEHIHRHFDCDADDVIYSTIFSTDNEPTDWLLETCEPDEGDY